MPKAVESIHGLRFFPTASQITNNRFHPSLEFQLQCTPDSFAAISKLSFEPPQFCGEEKPSLLSGITKMSATPVFSSPRSSCGGEKTNASSRPKAGRGVKAEGSCYLYPVGAADAENCPDRAIQEQGMGDGKEINPLRPRPAHRFQHRRRNRQGKANDEAAGSAKRITVRAPLALRGHPLRLVDRYR